MKVFISIALSLVAVAVVLLFFGADMANADPATTGYYVSPGGTMALEFRQDVCTGKWYCKVWAKENGQWVQWMSQEFWMITGWSNTDWNEFYGYDFEGNPFQYFAVKHSTLPMSMEVQVGMGQQVTYAWTSSLP